MKNQENSIYKFYIYKLISRLKNLNIKSHLQILGDYNIKIGVFDFCGRLKFYARPFLDVSADCWVVENDWENDITDILFKYDIVYFFDDLEFVNDNIFYEEYTNKSNFIFVLFSGCRFKFLQTYI